MVAQNTLTRKIQRLENLHCQRNDLALRRELLQTLSIQRSKEALADAAGIDDADLVDRLFQAGFTAQTLPAITLAPIALVAWGSGSVTDEERAAAMRAVYDSDLSGNHAAVEQFQSWLDSRPPSDLLLLWADFTQSQVDTSRTSILDSKHDRMICLASDVAIASGGLLGFGAICPGEQSVLDRIRDVLFGTPAKGK